MVVHNSEPPTSREIVGLTEEISLDLAHYPQEAFSQPRRLRKSPWLGSYLCANSVVLHDTAHWFEFTQASGCAQFGQPEYVMERARPLAEEARQIWFDLHLSNAPAGPEEVFNFLTLIKRAGNAFAVLNGPPLPLRRFFLDLPDRANALNRPGMAAGLADLLGAGESAKLDWDRLSGGWSAALHAAAQSDECPPRLSTPRHPYYQRAVDAMRDDEPAAALWVLFETWTEAICCLPADETLRQQWDSARQSLGLGAEQFTERVSAADAYLDTLEETLDVWAEQNGVNQ